MADGVLVVCFVASMVFGPYVLLDGKPLPLSTDSLFLMPLLMLLAIAVGRGVSHSDGINLRSKGNYLRIAAAVCLLFPAVRGAVRLIVARSLPEHLVLAGIACGLAGLLLYGLTLPAFCDKG